MDRRTFVLTPIAFASLYGAVPAFTHAASTGAPNSVRVPISFTWILLLSVLAIIGLTRALRFFQRESE